MLRVKCLFLLLRNSRLWKFKRRALAANEIRANANVGLWVREEEKTGKSLTGVETVESTAGVLQWRPIRHRAAILQSANGGEGRGYRTVVTSPSGEGRRRCA